MQMDFLICCLLVLLLCFATETEVRAADIQIITRDRDLEKGCNIRISGAIVEGDAIKFRRALLRLNKIQYEIDFTKKYDKPPEKSERLQVLEDILRQDSKKSLNLEDPNFDDSQLGVESVLAGGFVQVCLDSPGGSYLEGLTLAKIVHKVALGTVIERDAKCFSACALIFMAGSATGRHFYSPARSLHYLGKLSFHAPYLPSITVKLSQEDIQKVHIEAISSISKLLNVFPQTSTDVGEAGYWIRPSLLAEILKKRPDEEFSISTVGRAGRMQIPLLTDDKFIEINDVRLKHACWNYLWWSRDLEPPTDDISDAIKKLKSMWVQSYGVKTKITVMQIVGYTGYRRPYCIVNTGSSQKFKQGSISIVENNFDIDSDTELEKVGGKQLPFWWTYPSDTKLSSIGNP